jgi:hypothetical protein
VAKVHLADIFAGARAGFHLDGAADGSDSGREVWFLVDTLTMVWEEAMV